MRFIILGNDTGNGKTLSSVYLAKYYFDRKYQIYSNIELTGKMGKEFILIDGSNFIDDIPDSQSRKVVLLDEIGQSTYQHTKTSVGLSHIISQSRKSIGERSHLIANTQMSIQLNPVWRGLADFYIYPEIYELNNEKIPLMCMWYIEKKMKGFISPDQYIKNTYFKHYNTVLIKNIYKCLGMYNTHIETDKFKDDRIYNKLKKKYVHMKNQDKMVSNFKAVLTEAEGLNPTEADRIARSIIFEDLINKT